MGGTDEPGLQKTRSVVKLASESDGQPMNHSLRQLGGFPFVVSWPVILIKASKKQLTHLWL